MTKIANFSLRGVQICFNLQKPLKSLEIHVVREISVISEARRLFAVTRTCSYNSWPITIELLATTIEHAIITVK